MKRKILGFLLLFGMTFSYTNADPNCPEPIKILDNGITVAASDCALAGQTYTLPADGKEYYVALNKFEIRDKIRAGTPANQIVTTKVTDFRDLFDGMPDFNQPIGNWDVSNVINMYGAFGEALSFNQDISKWNTSKVTNMSWMFGIGTASGSGLVHTFNQPIGDWDVSNVTAMEGMFQFNKSFNQDISKWNVGKVRNMKWMFTIAESFNQPIGDWDVSSVETMTCMFCNIENGTMSFNQDISRWNVSKVKDMSGMFQASTSFNQPIGDWDVSSVEDMSSMFRWAKSFNQPIGNWKLTSLRDMKGMFYEAYDFNQPIGDWDISNITDLDGVFLLALSFNQDLSKWNVEKVKNMYGLFYGTPFDQDISAWNPISLETAEEFFYEGDKFSKKNYDKLLNSWATKNLKNGVIFQPSGRKYCLGDDARQSLLDDKNWTIKGDSKDCDIEKPTVDHPGFTFHPEEEKIVFTLPYGEDNVGIEKYVYIIEECDLKYNCVEKVGETEFIEEAGKQEKIVEFFDINKDEEKKYALTYWAIDTSGNVSQKTGSIDRVHISEITFKEGENGEIEGTKNQKYFTGKKYKNISLPIPKPKVGYKFVNWTDENGEEFPTDLEKIIEKSLTYTANFVKDDNFEDLDGDGVSNEEEEKHGSDPRDANSKPNKYDYEPEVKNLRKEANQEKLTEEEVKKAITNQDTFPKGTVITIDPKVNISEIQDTAGEKEIELKVTYPDGSFDLVKVKLTVEIGKAPVSPVSPKVENLGKAPNITELVKDSRVKLRDFEEPKEQTKKEEKREEIKVEKKEEKTFKTTNNKSEIREKTKVPFSTFVDVETKIEDEKIKSHMRFTPLSLPKTGAY